MPIITAQADLAIFLLFSSPLYLMLIGCFFRYMQDLGRDIAADDTSTGGQMSPLTAAASGALFGAGMIDKPKCDICCFWG